MREIVFDTETTGLDPGQGDRICEIGCVELVNRVETGRTFHAYVNPMRAMPSIAQQVHGLSDVFLADKPCFDAIVEDLLDFLEDSPLVAHNAAFDFAFLNHEMGECGRMNVSLSRMICTAQLSKSRHPGAKHSLDALCTRYGVDRSHRVLHGALLDAQLLAQVYVELTGGRQIGFDIAPTAAALPEMKEVHRNPLVRRPRRHDATAEEIMRHRGFVTQLKDPLWALDDHWHEAA
jgi:DNA polymerase-3 subunit epsilon